jgi:predicted nucleic acid-binding protein
MRVFVDSNIFIAVLTEENERFEEAKRLLNSEHEIVTSMLNLMEIRSVLSKKKKHKKSEIEDIEQDIVDMTDIIIPDSSDFLEANRIQEETLAYPMDSLIMALAKSSDAELSSFDKELTELGAKTPEKFLN